MEKRECRQHDFSLKLRQRSILPHLKAHVIRQRGNPAPGEGSAAAAYGPVSINLDLTSACNFACPHCVDSGIVNAGEAQLPTGDTLRTLDTLAGHGLRSVILLGGGEPTLHKDFEEIFGRIKAKGLQLGISTNGTRLDRVARVAAQMTPKDWLRISIDAASEDTFVQSHLPKISVSLSDVLRRAQEIKAAHPHISLGYSFVIVWEGITANGRELCPNVDEMADAVTLARRHGFDYVSFKPCLVRLDDSRQESLLHNVEEARQKRIAEALRKNLQEARLAAEGEISIVESVNLQALLGGKVAELKTQPAKCHLQFFRTVVSPAGIFHCPACRGMQAARLAGPDGYADEERFESTLRATQQSIEAFDASRECSVVGCFYHHTNWWLEEYIRSGASLDEISPVSDSDFFL